MKSSFFAIFVVLAGCGSGGSSATSKPDASIPDASTPDASTQVTPSCSPQSQPSCGGDLVGQWSLASGSCVDLGGPTLSIDGQVTLTFGAQGEYTAGGTGTFTVIAPPSTFAADAGGAFPTCAALTSAVESSGGTCSQDSAQDCVCIYPGSTLNNAGTYSVSSASLTRPTGTNATVTEGYCVDSGTLDIQFTFGNFTGMAAFDQE